MLSDEPRRLSADEERRLAEMDRTLSDENPELAGLARGPQRAGVLDVVLGGLAVLVILWVVLPASWFAVVILVVLMTWPILLAKHLVPWEGRKRER